MAKRLRLTCTYCGGYVLWANGLPLLPGPGPDWDNPLPLPTFMYCVERRMCGATWSSIGTPAESSHYRGGRWRAMWRFLRSEWREPSARRGMTITMIHRGDD